MSSPDIGYWLGFHLVPGVSAGRLETLIARFGSLEAAWHASPAALRQAGLPERVVEALVEKRRQLDLGRELERARRSGATLIPLAEDAYPRLLKEIASPPLVLFVRGELRAEDEQAIALVGTRRPTAYGKDVALQLSGELASRGVVIVSGLARGIDRVAHEAALDAGGRTIAVLGSGIDVIYPPEHARLAERIAGQGALVTEFPPGEQPMAKNFPVRNRLISGLSLGVVVVEAPRKSGALITANFAADQGRTVYAVPGPIFSPMSAGTLQLLREGATPIGSAEDILRDLRLEARQLTLEARAALPASPEEREILAHLRPGPCHIDDLAAQLGLGISQVSALLMQMQLKGLVRHLGAQHYAGA
uniref:DNA-protecting protein DprA n=1 Tax=Thermorudis peleae TaxID=1382356 RepID=A0A831TE30_9BACT